MPAYVQTAQAEETIEIVLVGDTGFNAAGAPVSVRGGYKNGQLVNIHDALRGIRDDMDADIVVANLETAVTDRNDLAGLEKRFIFRTHPDAVTELVDAGINVFSLANNHALDYRQRGAGDTLMHLEAMRPRGLLAFAGLGRDRAEALRPHVFRTAGVQVAVSAVGIGGWGLPAPKAGAGMLRYPDDFAAVSDALNRQDANIRILSVHYGREFQPTTTADTRARFRGALVDHGITLVAGHHKHVANGVEIIEKAGGGTGLIFYGLGNFLHLGMQDMGRHDLCHDFGLLARVKLRKDGDAISVASVQIVPLTDMHSAVRRLPREAAALRVQVMNHLSDQLGDADVGTRGLAFIPQPDGSGLWCNGSNPASGCVIQPSRTPAPAVSDTIRAACARTLTR